MDFYVAHWEVIHVEIARVQQQLQYEAASLSVWTCLSVGNIEFFCSFIEGPVSALIQIK